MQRARLAPLGHRWLCGWHRWKRGKGKAQDGRFIGHDSGAIKLRECARGGVFVEFFLRLLVAQVPANALHLFEKASLARFVGRREQIQGSVGGLSCVDCSTALGYVARTVHKILVSKYLKRLEYHFIAGLSSR